MDIYIYRYIYSIQIKIWIYVIYCNISYQTCFFNSSRTILHILPMGQITGYPNLAGLHSEMLTKELPRPERWPRADSSRLAGTCGAPWGPHPILLEAWNLVISGPILRPFSEIPEIHVIPRWFPMLMVYWCKNRKRQTLGETQKEWIPLGQRPFAMRTVCCLRTPRGRWTFRKD
jgi:hypothetical protein